ncbi:MAG: outer membrane lipoprotein carrier protein LolA [Chitinophagia bacterium]|nr:outer membrane lipoprotein carrier protein LolA [Chitinophagia bacterium]
MKLVLKATALLCLLLPISLNNAMAQTDAAKAKTILEAVSKKVKALSTLKAGFTLQISNGKAGGSQETKKGTIALKGSKYHLLLGEQEVLCNTKLIWTYNPDSKEVQLSNYNPNDNNSLSPEKLLTNFYDKNYTYTYRQQKAGLQN